MFHGKDKWLKKIKQTTPTFDDLHNQKICADRYQPRENQLNNWKK